MILTGKKEDLEEAKNKTSLYKKVIASMLLAGTIIGVGSAQAHAAGAYQNESQHYGQTMRSIKTKSTKYR